MDLEPMDNRQQEEEERIQIEGSFAEYWAKREQDKRDERDFWRRWDEKWSRK